MFRIVLIRIQKTDIFFDLLSESLWTLLRELLQVFFKFFQICQRSAIDIGLEKASLADAVLEDHEADAVLEAVVPVASVDGAVVPIHFAVADLDVLGVVAFVFAAALPGELSIPMLLIILVLALILVTVLIAILFPMALTVLLAIVELP